MTTADGPYMELPFTMPEGVGRIDLSYRYPGKGEGVAIDLGLLDTRRAPFPALPGFRGWSGTARAGAVITEGWATPGYLPGPIPPGTWSVLLGLYHLPAEGVEVEVLVELTPEAGPRPAELGEPPAPLPRQPPSRGAGPRWFRGELHSHTHHSDAPGSLEALIERARARRLDFVAVTEHNTTSHLPYLERSPADLLLVPGLEVTSYAGHMNVWGVAGALDFRCTTHDQIAAVIDRAHAAGAICSASHPVIPGMGWSFGYHVPIDCLEVWHGPTRAFNAVTLDAWDQLLRSGRKVVAVGGGDHHEGMDDWLARPVVWIRAEALTVDGILEGLRRGRVMVAEPEAPWIELEVSNGGRIYGPGEVVPGERVDVRVRGGRTAGLQMRLVTALGEVDDGELDIARHRYVRAELRHDNDDPFPLVVLTNPVWGDQIGNAESEQDG